jgi:hypothetical protein
VLAKAIRAYSEIPSKPEAKAAVIEEFEKVRQSNSYSYLMESEASIKGTEGGATSVDAGGFYAKIIRLWHE